MWDDEEPTDRDFAPQRLNKNHHAFGDNRNTKPTVAAILGDEFVIALEQTGVGGKGRQSRAARAQSNDTRDRTFGTVVSVHIIPTKRLRISSSRAGAIGVDAAASERWQT